MSNIVHIDDMNRLARIVTKLNEEVLKMERLGASRKTESLRVRVKFVMTRLEIARKKRRQDGKTG